MAAATLAMVAASSALAQTPIRTAEVPGGGTITYGTVDGATSEADAMGRVLRILHDRNGDRPQVGRPFQARGTISTAVLFTLVKRKQDNTQVRGMLIAARSGPQTYDAALLTDAAARFDTTIQPMMQTLFKAWHPSGGGSTGTAAGSGSAGGGSASAPPDAPAPVAPLQRFTLPDNSASVELPAGWKVPPKGAGGGTIFAFGPGGETAMLGLAILVNDANNPSARAQAQAVARSGGTPQVPLYPYGTDMTRAFVDLMHFRQQHDGFPAADFRIAASSPMEVPPPQRCAHLTGQIDWRMGKPVNELNAVFCEERPGPYGMYMTMVYLTAVPLAQAPKERATLARVMASFSVNGPVVQQMAGRIAQPAIDQIHAIGRLSALQAQAADARREQSSAAFHQRWDQQDRQSQEFSNYLLDKSVVRDADNNAHGTLWNSDAQALVKTWPDRFQYVDKPEYWKGIDY
jgi:hypothetical protein